MYLLLVSQRPSHIKLITWCVGEKEKNENETFKKAVMWMFNQG